MKGGNEGLTCESVCANRATAIQDIVQLKGALSSDDLRGLMDIVMHRLLDLTECDYIAIHSVDGDHLMLHPGGELKTCPGRCEACSFYKLNIPPVADKDHFIELADTKRHCVARSRGRALRREALGWSGSALSRSSHQHLRPRQNRAKDFCGCPYAGAGAPFCDGAP